MQRIAEMAKSPIRLDKLFKGRHFEREIIILCVRWYLRWLRCKFLIWLTWSYVSVALHAASTAFHIVDVVLV
jgi:hypothetical protein